MKGKGATRINLNVPCEIWKKVAEIEGEDSQEAFERYSIRAINEKVEHTPQNSFRGSFPDFILAAIVEKIWKDTRYVCEGGWK